MVTCFCAAFTILSVYTHTPSFHYICVEWYSLPSHQLYPQSSEESFFQGFHKYVCNLILCSNMIDADCPFLDFFSEVMVFDVQVFGSYCHFWYCNFNCSLIVFKDFAMNVGGLVNTFIPWSCASCINHIMGNNSLIAWDNAMYSASVDDKAILVHILDAQCMGHPEYLMMYPILDLAVLGSFLAVLLLHSNACAESTQHSIPLLSSVIMSPLSSLANRYHPIFWTASACLVSDLALNLAHWCSTCYVWSGWLL